MAAAGYSQRSRSRLPASATFIHQFAHRRGDLANIFPRLARVLEDEGTLWISWPKQASGVQTDLNENVVREIGLAYGLVDVKVAAVDEVWSGLKFVRRVVNRRESRVKSRKSLDSRPLDSRLALGGIAQPPCS